jgi:hypothetical protein
LYHQVGLHFGCHQQLCQLGILFNRTLAQNHGAHRCYTVVHARTPTHRPTQTHMYVHRHTLTKTQL